MARRRGNGEGSIYRRKDGLWVGQYKIEIRGERKTKYLYAKTRKSVASKLAQVLSERERGIVYDSGSMTVEEYFLRWLGSIEGNLRVSTVRRSESACRVHIFPRLGDRKLERLSPLQLQDLYQEKLASGLSVRSVQIIHATLHKGLGQAVRWSLVPRNVASLADTPKYRRKDVNPLSEEQVRVLVNTVSGDYLEALYVLAVTTGLRQGEILALQWGDLDFSKQVLQVKRTISEGGVNPPKTKSGKRSIQLGRMAVEALRNHPKSSEWIFCTQGGKPIQANNLYNRQFKPLLKRAGLPDIRFHDLRHTCATLLLSKGVHPKIVSEMLGHASIGITLDTYSHVLPNMQEKAVEAMEDIFSKPEK